MAINSITVSITINQDSGASVLTLPDIEGPDLEPVIDLVQNHRKPGETVADATRRFFAAMLNEKLLAWALNKAQREIRTRRGME